MAFFTPDVVQQSNKVRNSQRLTLPKCKNMERHEDSAQQIRRKQRNPDLKAHISAGSASSLGAILSEYCRFLDEEQQSLRHHHQPSPSSSPTTLDGDNCTRHFVAFAFACRKWANESQTAEAHLQQVTRVSEALRFLVAVSASEKVSPSPSPTTHHSITAAAGSNTCGRIPLRWVPLHFVISVSLPLTLTAPCRFLHKSLIASMKLAWKVVDDHQQSRSENQGEPEDRRLPRTATAAQDPGCSEKITTKTEGHLLRWDDDASVKSSFANQFHRLLFAFAATLGNSHRPREASSAAASEGDGDDEDDAAVRRLDWFNVLDGLVTTVFPALPVEAFRGNQPEELSSPALELTAAASRGLMQIIDRVYQPRRAAMDDSEWCEHEPPPVTATAALDASVPLHGGGGGDLQPPPPAATNSSPQSAEEIDHLRFALRVTTSAYHRFSEEYAMVTSEAAATARNSVGGAREGGEVGGGAAPIVPNPCRLRWEAVTSEMGRAALLLLQRADVPKDLLNAASQLLMSVIRVTCGGGALNPPSSSRRANDGDVRPCDDERRALMSATVNRLGEFLHWLAASLGTTTLDRVHHEDGHTTTATPTTGLLLPSILPLSIYAQKLTAVGAFCVLRSFLQYVANREDAPPLWPWAMVAASGPHNVRHDDDDDMRRAEAAADIVDRLPGSAAPPPPQHPTVGLPFTSAQPNTTLLQVVQMLVAQWTSRLDQPEVRFLAYQTLDSLAKFVRDLVTSLPSEREPLNATVLGPLAALPAFVVDLSPMPVMLQWVLDLATAIWDDPTQQVAGPLFDTCDAVVSALVALQQRWCNSRQTAAAEASIVGDGCQPQRWTIPVVVVSTPRSAPREQSVVVFRGVVRLPVESTGPGSVVSSSADAAPHFFDAVLAKTLQMSPARRGRYHVLDAALGKLPIGIVVGAVAAYYGTRAKGGVTAVVPSLFLRDLVLATRSTKVASAASGLIVSLVKAYLRDEGSSAADGLGLTTCSPVVTQAVVVAQPMISSPRAMGSDQVLRHILHGLLPVDDGAVVEAVAFDVAALPGVITHVVAGLAAHFGEGVVWRLYRHAHQYHLHRRHHRHRIVAPPVDMGGETPTRRRVGGDDDDDDTGKENLCRCPRLAYVVVAATVRCRNTQLLLDEWSIADPAVEAAMHTESHPPTAAISSAGGGGDSRRTKQQKRDDVERKRQGILASMGSTPELRRFIAETMRHAITGPSLFGDATRLAAVEALCLSHRALSRVTAFQIECVETFLLGQCLTANNQDPTFRNSVLLVVKKWVKRLCESSCHAIKQLEQQKLTRCRAVETGDVRDDTFIDEEGLVAYLDVVWVHVTCVIEASCFHFNGLVAVERCYTALRLWYEYVAGMAPAVDGLVDSLSANATAAPRAKNTPAMRQGTNQRELHRLHHPDRGDLQWVQAVPTWLPTHTADRFDSLIEVSNAGWDKLREVVTQLATLSWSVTFKRCQALLEQLAFRTDRDESTSLGTTAMKDSRPKVPTPAVSSSVDLCRSWLEAFAATVDSGRFRDCEGGAFRLTLALQLCSREEGRINARDPTSSSATTTCGVCSDSAISVTVPLPRAALEDAAGDPTREAASCSCVSVRWGHSEEDSGRQELLLTANLAQLLSRIRRRLNLLLPTAAVANHAGDVAAPMISAVRAARLPLHGTIIGITAIWKLLTDARNVSSAQSPSKIKTTTTSSSSATSDFDALVVEVLRAVSMVLTTARHFGAGSAVDCRGHPLTAGDAGNDDEVGVRSDDDGAEDDDERQSTGDSDDDDDDDHADAVAVPDDGHSHGGDARRRGGTKASRTGRLAVNNVWLAARTALALAEVVLKSLPLSRRDTLPSSPRTTLSADDGVSRKEGAAEVPVHPEGDSISFAASSAVVHLVSDVCYSVMALLLETKHNGVMAKARDCLASYAAALLRASEPCFRDLPMLFLRYLLFGTERGVTSANSSRMLRRSQGLPHAILPLLDAEDPAMSLQLLPVTMTVLLGFAREAVVDDEDDVPLTMGVAEGRNDPQGDETAAVPSPLGDKPTRRIHGVNAMNVLKFVFSDGLLAARVVPWLEPCVLVAAHGMIHHQDWFVRNSSLMLFTVAAQRLVGDHPSKGGGGVASTLRDVTRRFPKVVACLVQQTTSTATPSSSSTTGAATAVRHRHNFPLLLLLAMLRPDALHNCGVTPHELEQVSTLGPGRLMLSLCGDSTSSPSSAHYESPLLKLLNVLHSVRGSSDLMVRGVAANALVSLLPVEWVPIVLRNTTAILQSAYGATSASSSPQPAGSPHIAPPPPLHHPSHSANWRHGALLALRQCISSVLESSDDQVLFESDSHRVASPLDDACNVVMWFLRRMAAGKEACGAVAVQACFAAAHLIEAWLGRRSRRENKSGHYQTSTQRGLVHVAAAAVHRLLSPGGGGYRLHLEQTSTEFQPSVGALLAACLRAVDRGDVCTSTELPVNSETTPSGLLVDASSVLNLLNDVFQVVESESVVISVRGDVVVGFNPSSWAATHALTCAMIARAAGVACTATVDATATMGALSTTQQLNAAGAAAVVAITEQPRRAALVREDLVMLTRVWTTCLKAGVTDPITHHAASRTFHSVVDSFFSLSLQALRCATGLSREETVLLRASAAPARRSASGEVAALSLIVATECDTARLSEVSVPGPVGRRGAHPTQVSLKTSLHHACHEALSTAGSDPTAMSHALRSAVLRCFVSLTISPSVVGPLLLRLNEPSADSQTAASWLRDAAGQLRRQMHSDQPLEARQMGTSLLPLLAQSAFAVADRQSQILDSCPFHDEPPSPSQQQHDVDLAALDVTVALTLGVMDDDASVRSPCAELVLALQSASRRRSFTSSSSSSAGQATAESSSAVAKLSDAAEDDDGDARRRKRGSHVGSNSLSVAHEVVFSHVVDRMLKRPPANTPTSSSSSMSRTLLRRFLTFSDLVITGLFGATAVSGAGGVVAHGSAFRTLFHRVAYGSGSGDFDRAHADVIRHRLLSVEGALFPSGPQLGGTAPLGSSSLLGPLLDELTVTPPPGPPSVMSARNSDEVAVDVEREEVAPRTKEKPLLAGRRSRRLDLQLFEKDVDNAFAEPKVILCWLLAAVTAHGDNGQASAPTSNSAPVRTAWVRMMQALSS